MKPILIPLSLFLSFRMTAAWHFGPLTPLTSAAQLQMTWVRLRKRGQFLSTFVVSVSSNDLLSVQLHRQNLRRFFGLFVPCYGFFFCTLESVWGGNGGGGKGRGVGFFFIRLFILYSYILIFILKYCLFVCLDVYVHVITH